MQSSVSDIEVPPAEGIFLPKYQSMGEDNRVKLFFFGNWPLHADNPDMHFLITPRGYEPGSTPGTHQMLYFSIGPDYVYSFLTNEGKAEPVDGRKGIYMRLHYEDDAVQNVRIIPFISSAGIESRLCPKSVKETMLDIIKEQWIQSIREKPDEAEAKKEYGGLWQKNKDAKKSLDNMIGSTYSILKSSFISSIDRNLPARWSLLSPTDWFTRRFPLDAPGRILDYVKDVLGWIVHG
jgi:hypothetical protein